MSLFSLIKDLGVTLTFQPLYADNRIMIQFIYLFFTNNIPLFWFLQTFFQNGEHSQIKSSKRGSFWLFSFIFILYDCRIRFFESATPNIIKTWVCQNILEAIA